MIKTIQLGMIGTFVALFAWSLFTLEQVEKRNARVNQENVVVRYGR